MFGFVIGVAATLGFLAYRRHGFSFGHGCGFGRGMHGRHGLGGGRRGYGWRPFMMGSLFRRLETTPSQEDAIGEAFDTLRRTAREQKAGLREWRENLARTLASESLDDKALRAALDSHDERIATMKGAVADALTKVHGALDPIQREELAEIVADGMHGRHRRGYR